MTSDDIYRLGLTPPSGERLGLSVPVSAADVAQLGLSAPAGDDAGADRASPADIERYGIARRRPIRAGRREPISQQGISCARQ